MHNIIYIKVVLPGGFVEFITNYNVLQRPSSTERQKVIIIAYSAAAVLIARRAGAMRKIRARTRVCPRGCGAVYGDVSSATTASRSRRQRTAGNRRVVRWWWGDWSGRASAIVVAARSALAPEHSPRPACTKGCRYHHRRRWQRSPLSG